MIMVGGKNLQLVDAIKRPVRVYVTITKSISVVEEKTVDMSILNLINSSNIRSLSKKSFFLKNWNLFSKSEHITKLKIYHNY